MMRVITVGNCVDVKGNYGGDKEIEDTIDEDNDDDDDARDINGDDDNDDDDNNNNNVNEDHSG